MDRASARQLFQQGVQSSQSGDLAAALAAFEQVYLRTCNPKVLYNIGVMRERQHNTEGAIEAFQLYLQKEPESSHAKDVQEKLNQLEESR